MRVFLRIVGVLMVVGALCCGWIAYAEAGGMHGFSAFLRRLPDGLARNDAPLALAGMGGLLVVGIPLIIFTKRKKQAG